jgi:hypothetical protein
LFNLILEFHGSQTEVESQAETVKGIAEENQGRSFESNDPLEILRKEQKL